MDSTNLTVNPEKCKDCGAKHVCNRYQDYLEEQEKTADALTPAV